MQTSKDKYWINYLSQNNHNFPDNEPAQIFKLIDVIPYSLIIPFLYFAIKNLILQ